jgi:predicted RNA-binding Zn-ribbon protein involved in translation (DUF1610 family)
VDERISQVLRARSRGEVKRWGAWLDGPGHVDRAALVAAARKRGAEVPDDWESLDGRRLLKACLARADEAQVRTNPIQRDEAFTCVRCGADVPVGGRRPRDHCPRCLASLHVDQVPGDRAAECGGALIPVRAVPSPKGLVLEYRCDRCGILRRNRVLDDVEPPDDAEVVRKLLVDPDPSG